MAALKQDNWSEINSSEIIDYVAPGLIKMADVGVFWNDKSGKITHTLSTTDEYKSSEDEVRSSVVEYTKFIIGNRVLINGNNSDYIEKHKNFELLSEMINSDVEDEEYVSDDVINRALVIIAHVDKQPELFSTGNNSINMQYEKEDGSYLEFELFDDRIVCMFIPMENYERADFPDVKDMDFSEMNRIIGEFYGCE